MDHRQATMICGQCHRQSAMRELGPNGEMNYRQAPPYYVWTLSRPYLEFGSRAFYKDGRFRETTVIGEAFLRSACFRRGTAHCASCHDPHPVEAAENRVSLKFRQDPDRMCLQCHAEIGTGGLPRHTRHAPASSGSRCAACHMPPIMNSLLFRAASHEIEIPRADLTARFGQRDSPNACLICHADRDVPWLAVQLQAWNASGPSGQESRLVNGADAH
jgi:predicted CXXCH cytochrome family protein